MTVVYEELKSAVTESTEFKYQLDIVSDGQGSIEEVEGLAVTEFLKGVTPEPASPRSRYHASIIGGMSNTLNVITSRQVASGELDDYYTSVSEKTQLIKPQLQTSSQLSSQGGNKDLTKSISNTVPNLDLKPGVEQQDKGPAFQEGKVVRRESLVADGIPSGESGLKANLPPSSLYEKNVGISSTTGSVRGNVGGHEFSTRSEIEQSSNSSITAGNFQAYRQSDNARVPNLPLQPEQKGSVNPPSQGDRFSQEVSAHGEPDSKARELISRAASRGLVSERVGASVEGSQNHSEALSTSKTMIDFMASRDPSPLGATGDSGAYAASQYSSTSGSGYQAKVSELKSDRYVTAGSGAPMVSASEQKVLIDGAPQKGPAYLSQTSFSREYLTENLSKLLGQRILANVKSGNYRLNFNIFPRELGMLDVTLELRDGRLEAQINATNVAARDLLNDSASRLRDALQASGFNNPSVDVTSDQGRREKRDGDANGQAGENVSGMTAQHDADNLLVVEDLYLDPNSVDMWV